MAQTRSKYGASQLHFAVWSGCAKLTRNLLEGNADVNAMDEDGQTPWAWAEAAKSKESILSILRAYGGGPSPVWTLKAQPARQEVFTLRAGCASYVMLSCTNLAGETVFHGSFPESASVADVVTGIGQTTGKAPTLVLPSNHVLGLSDYHLTFSKLLDSPPATEKRKDRKDGQFYSKREFFKYYGVQEGRAMWGVAVPDAVEVACAQSLMELAEVENTQISETFLRSLHEFNGGKKEVTPAIQTFSACPANAAAEHAMTPSYTPLHPPHNDHEEGMTSQILVIGFNKHPIEFTQAICESPFAQSLVKSGVDISPEWANGAKILVDGLTPLIMEEAAPPFPPGSLRRSHVVVHPENENDVLECLRGLSYRMRPREKSRNTITCQKQTSKGRPSSGYDFENGAEDEVEKDDGSVVEADTQGPKEYPGTSLPEDLCITRTFIDISKRLRVGWSPRSAYAKSSNDKFDNHGFENPRKWK